jgi:hypothetical protein
MQQTFTALFHLHHPSARDREGSLLEGKVPIEFRPAAWRTALYERLFKHAVTPGGGFSSANFPPY